MNPNPVTRLMTSSKAIVMLFVITAAYIGFFLGKTTWEQFAEFAKWIIGPWMVASGAEDVAKHIAAGKVESSKVTTEGQKAIHSASIPPPAVTNNTTIIEKQG